VKAAKLLVPLVALAIAACDGTEARNTAPASKAVAPVSVVTRQVEERRLPQVLDVTGTLMADAQSEIAAEVAGRIVEVAVERGGIVRAGALLARLDSEDYTHQLREAEATEMQTRERLGLGTEARFDPEATPDVRKVRATMERAEAENGRYARLVADGYVSRSEHELKRMEALTARAQYDETLNQVRQLYQTLQAQKARAAMARKALADTSIRAPFDGLVAERHVNVGQYVSRGARVATVVRVDPLRVELTIPEVAAAAVKPRQTVAFAVQTYPDRRFNGAIAYVGPALRPDTRALVVEAMVPNGTGVLRPGLFATAQIELPEARPSLLVPAGAVRTDSAVSRVWVVRDNRAEARLVQLGQKTGDLVEVLRGLARGERVVVEGVDRVGDATPISDAAGPR
jgi:RND family efflux transporter MFP subunit